MVIDEGERLLADMAADWQRPGLETAQCLQLAGTCVQTPLVIDCKVEVDCIAWQKR